MKNGHFACQHAKKCPPTCGPFFLMTKPLKAADEDEEIGLNIFDSKETEPLDNADEDAEIGLNVFDSRDLTMGADATQSPDDPESKDTPLKRRRRQQRPQNPTTRPPGSRVKPAVMQTPGGQHGQGA